MTRTILISLSFIAGCAADTTATGSQAERGPIGKADLVGSCAQTDCDGASPGGNCFCDDQCAEFGDCCGDKVEVCEGPVAPKCGGFLGTLCGEDMYCHYEQEDNCGAVDMIGTCREMPDACIEVFMPVCGCDGRTYSNSCFAAMAGASVVRDGACEEPGGGASCGGHLGLACGEDEYCHYEESAMCGAADHLGTCQPVPQACTLEVDPVCGCDGETHSNACFAAIAGTSVVHKGECQ